MTQHNTTHETNAQDIIERLTRMDYSIAKHDFDYGFHTDNELIMMVIRN